MKEKEVIVLIPHFNNLSGLKNSINSIEEDFNIDLMIVDDGSSITPKPKDFNDILFNGNIYIEKLETNLGIEHALNHGLKKILTLNYKYIARLDTGDLCHKNRFKEQINYLKNNLDVKLLGTQVNFISETKSFLYKSNLPITYEKIKKGFYINCLIIHPTVMFYSELLKSTGLYPLNYDAAEDYAFFFKIIKQHKVENLDRILLDVIIDENGISSIKRKQQIKSKIKIIKDNFYFGMHPVYGLVRNIMLLLVPRKVTTKVKKILDNNG